MQQAWFSMITCSCCFTFHAISVTNLLAVMTTTVNNLCKQIKNAHPSKINSNEHNYKVNPSTTIALGTEYSIELLLDDYQRLTLITQQYNMFASYKTFFLHACGYCQFIADVFLAVQVLRLPGTNVLDIWLV